MVKCWDICFSLCCALCLPPQRTRGGSNTAATNKKRTKSSWDKHKATGTEPTHIIFYYYFLYMFCACRTNIYSMLCVIHMAQTPQSLHWTLLWRACHRLQSESGTLPPVSPEGWGSTSWMVREIWGGGPLSALLCLFRGICICRQTFYKRGHFKLSKHLQKQARWPLKFPT